MTTLKWALAALLLLTLLPVNVSAQWWCSKDIPPPLSRKGEPMPRSWWDAAKEGSKIFGSNPFLIAAVADVEANGWRGGRLGKSKYQGPMGFNRGCRIPGDVLYTPEKQITWACRLLANGPRSLKRYNTTWWENNYLKDVTNLASKMEWEARQLAFGW